MANIKANIKSIERNEKARIYNRQIKSRVKTALKAVDKAIANNESDKLETLTKKAHSEITNAKVKNVFHKNKAARQSSRLDIRVNKLQSN